LELLRRKHKNAWDAVKEAIQGNSVNHSKPHNMALKLPNGSRAKKDKENMSILGPHCKKLLNKKTTNISPLMLTQTN
jgi:hypothetical protein